MEILTTVPEKFLFDDFTKKSGEADLIAFAESTEDIISFITKAKNDNKPIITVGANTGASGATLPLGGEYLLSLEKMNNIIGLDEETMTLTVEAGTTLHQVREFLGNTPYFYAPDPGSKDATLGGNAATNAGGMRAIKYGVTRDNIRGLEVALTNGEIIHVGGLNNKNSSGYDFKDLFIGSEGTLAIITKLQLKILPKPLFERDLLIGFAKLEDLAPVIFTILRSGITPAALEFFDNETMTYSENYTGIKMPVTKGEAFILLTVDGMDNDSLDVEIQQLANLAEQSGAIDLRVLNIEEKEITWNLRDNMIKGIASITQIEPFDIVVPVNKITDTIIIAKAKALELGLDATFFGHAGDGNIHATVLRGALSDEQWAQTIALYDDIIYGTVASNGGLPSAEHGIGTIKKKYLKNTIEPAHLALMKQIKHTLDPDNILNPGKIFDI